MRVVRKFMDVVPKDLPSLLFNRDMVFSIDVESGTKPIFILTYKIASEKFKKLEKQLEDLLSK